MAHWAESSAGSARRGGWVPQMSDTVGEETGLPLMHCPFCNLSRVIERRVRTPNENHGRVYFKCPRNASWVRGRACHYFRWQRGYYEDLVRAKVINELQVPEGRQGSAVMFEEIEESAVRESAKEGSLQGKEAVQAKEDMLQRKEGNEIEARLSNMMVGFKVLFMVVMVGIAGVALGYMLK